MTGRPAVIRGRAVQTLATLLILCALSIPVVFWYLFAMLGRIR